MELGLIDLEREKEKKVVEKNVTMEGKKEKIGVNVTSNVTTNATTSNTTTTDNSTTTENTTETATVED